MKVIQSIAAMFLLVATFVSAAASAQSEEGVAVAFSGNIVGDEATTRFFIDLDREIAIETFYLEAPRRIVIDMDETRFALPQDKDIAAAGLIENIQMGRIGEGRSRIVLKLSAPAEIIQASIRQKLDEDEYRFLIDLDATEETRFARLINSPRRVIGESGVKAVKPKQIQTQEKSPDTIRIVLDPGHGGIDSGAVGQTGVLEKDIVLNVASVLKDALAVAGPFEILETRSDDTFVSLTERLDMARNSQADLFISLHADSLRQKHVRGATIYTLSKKASDKHSEELAKSHNSVDLLAGLSLPKEESADVTDILVDLTAKETKKLSRKFSTQLLQHMKPEMRMIKNPQRSAAFFVLRAPEVPSVLIELGYLSNVDDEKLLADPKWQEKAVSAITDAITAFFKTRIN